MAPSRHTRDEVRAEIDWLLAFSGAGMLAARPLPTSDGGWLVTEGGPPLIAVPRGRLRVVTYRRTPDLHAWNVLVDESGASIRHRRR